MEKIGFVLLNALVGSYYVLLIKDEITPVLNQLYFSAILFLMAWYSACAFKTKPSRIDHTFLKVVLGISMFSGSYVLLEAIFA